MGEEWEPAPDSGAFASARSESQFGALNRSDEHDAQLRPRTLDEFVGQRRLVDNLRIALQAAKIREEPCDHVLLSGLPGLGKTTLCHLIAKEMGAHLVTSSGPALSRPADLAGMLTGLESGEVLFVDEVHRLPAAVEEYLYGAMEDYVVDISLDQGMGARSVRLPIAPFTLVAATTREGLLSAPFRGRFGIREKLESYPEEDLVSILVRSASLLPIGLSEEAAAQIATRSRGTPRIANRLLRRLRDLAQVRGFDRIEPDIAREGFERLGIDAHGLEETDRRILALLYRAGSRALGLKTIAAGVGESEDAIEEVYEPHLLRLELILKTPRGREITDLGRKLHAQIHGLDEPSSRPRGEDGCLWSND